MRDHRVSRVFRASAAILVRKAIPAVKVLRATSDRRVRLDQPDLPDRSDHRAISVCRDPEAFRGLPALPARPDPWARKA